ncbi:hypothetical protein MMC17_006448 [Xylographa soralifera]|nr:hypothetical protein [Xylographa soralifera]
MDAHLVKSAEAGAFPVEAKTIMAQDIASLPVTTPAAPAEYKIVKVRKPDGTIIKVKRPITRAASIVDISKATVQTSSGPSAYVSSRQDPEPTLSRNVIFASAEAQPKARLQVDKVTEPISSAVVTDTAPQAPWPTPQPSTSGKAPGYLVSKASKDATDHVRPARTYRLFRKVRRLGRHLTQTVQFLDANSDVGDIEDNADSFGSESGNETEDSSSDNGNARKDKRRDIRSAFKRQDSDNISVLSYTDGDSQIQQSDSDEKAGRAWGKRSEADTRSGVHALSTDHLRSHPTSHTTTSENIDTDFQPRDLTGTYIPTIKSKGDVEISEKELPSRQSDCTPKVHRKVPKSLRKRRSLSQFVVWPIMITLPLLYVVLGIMTALLNGKDSSSFMGSAMTEAIKISVTLWPIIFAAIAAQSLKMFASYKIERGLRLMTLEQLISSHSVASAIKQPFFLRRIDWLSAALLCLWSLSPLASQALQRMSYVDGDSTNGTTTVIYLDTTGSNFVFDVDAPYAAQFFPAEIQGLYTTSLMASNETQESPRDSWENIKIPILEGLRMGDDGWYEVNDANTPSAFSSMLGIPLVSTAQNQSDLDELEMYTTIHSAYLVLTDCSKIDITSMIEINQTGSIQYSSPSNTLFMGMQLYGEPVPESGDSSTDLRLPGRITFASSLESRDSPDYESDPGILPPQYSYSVCKINQTFVDSQVNCTGYQCQVTAMRLSLHPPPLTAIDTSFIQAFVNPTSGYEIGDYTFTERYLYNPNEVMNPSAVLDMSQVAPDQFQQRLSLLLNTFWQAGFDPTNQTTEVGTAGIDLEGKSYGNATWAKSNATYLFTQEVYITSWAWLAVLLGSSVVLLVAGVAGVIWDSHIVGPDILGFASSLTRNNKYMDLPKDESTMGGAERARLLRDVKVMMQDVKAGSEVGKVALGTVTESAQRLKLGRLYH